MRLQRWEQQQQNPASSLSLPGATDRTGKSPCGHGAKFSPKKAEAVAALLGQPTVERAAREVGVNPKTLQGWMRTAEFETEYRKACWEKFSAVVANFQHVRAFAATMLRKMNRDTMVPAMTRVGAANSLLRMAAEAMADLDNLRLRVQQLTQPQPSLTGSSTPDVRNAA